MPVAGQLVESGIVVVAVDSWAVAAVVGLGVAVEWVVGLGVAVEWVVD